MTDAKFVEAGGHRLDYCYFEPPAKAPGRPTFVMLHEGLGSVSMWKDFASRKAGISGVTSASTVGR